MPARMPIIQMPWGRLCRFLALAFAALSVCRSRAEDGYRLWLRYDSIDDASLRASYIGAASRIVLSTTGGNESPVISAARRELADGLKGLLGTSPPSVAPAHLG
jgi:alpha-glucuronidase